MSKDQLLLELIRQNEKTAVERFYMLYREEFIQWLRRQYRSTHETAVEIYQQAFIICYENILNGTLNTLTSSLKTYLFAIGRNKMNETLRDESKRMAAFSDFSKPQEEHEDSFNAADIQRVSVHLQQLGSPCRELLVAFYYQRRNLNEIALEMGYKNTDTVKNMKYKCLERLRKGYRNPGSISVDHYNLES